MRRLLEQLFVKTAFFYSLRNWVVIIQQKRALRDWEERGQTPPTPHIAKQRVLLEYAKKYDISILVETGTYCGDMVNAMKDAFTRIYSIELSEELFRRAKSRFRTFPHIELIHGDSGVALKGVMPLLDRPALFWLDGHYSGGVTAEGSKSTPIFEELDSILNVKEKRHVIIIDDANCFGTCPDYPSIPELTDYVRSRRPDMDLEVKDDTIRITPK